MPASPISPTSPSGPTSPTGSSRSNQLGRGKACLRCRRRKMVGAYLLEESVSDLESRICALQGGPTPILLYNPHDVYEARHRDSVGHNTTPEPVGSSQLILQSFLNVGPMFGFFFDIPRFVKRLRRTTAQGSLPSVSSIFTRTIKLVGSQFCNDSELQEDTLHRLPSLLRDVATSLDDPRKMDVLQAEVLLAYYFLHTNRRTEGFYHIAGAVSIAIACNLYQVRTAAQQRRRVGLLHQVPSSTSGDDDVDDCIRAFWTVFTLERVWSPWTTSPPAWPSEITNQEGNLTRAFRSSSEEAVSRVLSEVKAEIPEQLLLLLRSNSAILFGEASYLADRRGTDSTVLQSECAALENRINNFVRVLLSFDFTNQDPHRQRSLLLTRTLLSCSTIQLLERICHPWDAKYVIMLDAALAAINTLKALDFEELACVDPVLGMLWSIVGNTLVATLKLLQDTPPASLTSTVSTRRPHVNESTVNDALDSLCAAMQSLASTCPLIGHKLDSLQSAIESDQLSAIIV
ncbi:hypothetical protein PHLGIDRAFT_509991 [Phlebiopsis gigantea 11061_1 CR5-6]|uniref:Xylanolytic transcriptional activator regulatory domain-containing protein n=1 Tax=Phlebiopsis gigantea (strain 11061_1 CR5-6) TaxID=745531 RepID=A0A0C3RP22_PHLG1|nr:hypothetical protein PHLGIDRAFT_509991 [Phlebiopsis gigantea 11061_1 CR5-6]